MNLKKRNAINLNERFKIQTRRLNSCQQLLTNLKIATQKTDQNNDKDADFGFLIERRMET